MGCCQHRPDSTARGMGEKHTPRPPSSKSGRVHNLDGRGWAMSTLKDGLDAIRTAGLGGIEKAESNANVQKMGVLAYDKKCVVVVPSQDEGALVVGNALHPEFEWVTADALQGATIDTKASFVLLCEDDARKAIAQKVRDTRGARIVGSLDRLTELETATGSESGAGVSVVALLRERGVERTREAIRAIVEPKSAAADVPPWQDPAVLARAGRLTPIQADATAQPPPSVLWAIDAEGTRHELATVGSLVSIRSQPGHGKTAIAWAAACSVEAGLIGEAFDHTRTLGFGCSLSAALIVDTENEAAALPRQLADTIGHRLQEQQHGSRIHLYSHKSAPSGTTLYDYLAAASELNRQHGGDGVLVVLDRLSDFLRSDNDEQEVKATLDVLASWAEVERSVVIVIQHQKRNSTDGNGWTGSESQRKVSAALLVSRDKDTGVSTIKADKLRRGDETKYAVRFSFDSYLGLFVWSGEAPPKAGSVRAMQHVKELAAEFGSEPFTVEQAKTFWQMDSKQGAQKRLRALEPSVTQVTEAKGRTPATWRVRTPSDGEE